MRKLTNIQKLHYSTWQIDATWNRHLHSCSSPVAHRVIRNIFASPNQKSTKVIDLTLQINYQKRQMILHYNPLIKNR